MLMHALFDSVSVFSLLTENITISYPVFCSSFLPSTVIASAPSGHKDGSSGSLTLSTGLAKGGQASSGSINLNTGDVVGGPAGEISIEVGEARETYDIGASIEFKTGYNPNTSSGAFRVQTADAGRTGDSGEISLRTGSAKGGNSGPFLVETGQSTHGEGGEWIFYLLCTCFAAHLISLSY